VKVWRFLPGDLLEKNSPYLRPLYDALDEMVPKDLLKKYMEQRIVEVIPLAICVAGPSITLIGHSG